MLLFYGGGVFVVNDCVMCVVSYKCFVLIRLVVLRLY